MYYWKMGNDSYVQKIYGDPVLWDDRAIGYFVLAILLGIVIGPIVFFSEYMFIETNPVLETHISVALVVTKTLSKCDLINRSIWKWEDTQNGKKVVDKGPCAVSTNEIDHALENDSLHLFDMAYKNSYISRSGDELNDDFIFGH